MRKDNLALNSEGVSSFNTLFAWLPFFLFFVYVLSFCFAMPAFDLDESLYLVLSNRVEAPFTWVEPLWDGEAYRHKPPLYLWLLQLFKSGFFISNVSLFWQTFLSRLFSAVLSVLTVLVLSIEFPNLTTNLHAKNREKFTTHFFFKLNTPFFLLGSCLILLDPLLCFFLAIQLKVLRAFHKETKKYSITRFICGMLATAFAFATKGLIAIVVPAFCVGLFFLYEKNVVFFVRRGMLLTAGFALGALHFVWLYFHGGEKFVEDFFLVHHFKRSTQSFEGHGGPFYYYIPLLVLGLGPVFWRNLKKTSVEFSELPQFSNFSEISEPSFRSSNVFDWVWVSSWLIFFSMLATKLPNYIWPCFLPLLVVSPQVANKDFFQKTCSALAVISGFFWAFIGLLFALFPLVFSSLKTNTFFTLEPRVQSVLHTISIAPFQHSLMFLAGFSLILWVWKQKVQMLLISFTCLVVCLGQLSRENVFTPMKNAVEFAKQNAHKVSTVGLLSPNATLVFTEKALSLKSPSINVVSEKNETEFLEKVTFAQYGKGQYRFAFEGGKLAQSGVAEEKISVVLPSWLEKRCDEYNFMRRKSFGYLIVCRKN